MCELSIPICLVEVPFGLHVSEVNCKGIEKPPRWLAGNTVAGILMRESCTKPISVTCSFTGYGEFDVYVHSKRVDIHRFELFDDNEKAVSDYGRVIDIREYVSPVDIIDQIVDEHNCVYISSSAISSTVILFVIACCDGREFLNKRFISYTPAYLRLNLGDIPDMIDFEGVDIGRVRRFLADIEKRCEQREVF